MAVFQLGANRAPSPNGFSSLFYQHNWDLMGPSLCNTVRSFYENGFLLKELNRTSIILISRCHNPISIHQFFPISLCNFVYKVIFKTIVNRLKPWMHSLIPNGRSVFIPN